MLTAPAAVSPSPGRAVAAEPLLLLHSFWAIPLHLPPYKPPKCPAQAETPVPCLLSPQGAATWLGSCGKLSQCWEHLYRGA